MKTSKKTLLITVCIKFLLLNFLLNFTALTLSETTTHSAEKISHQSSENFLSSNQSRGDTTAIKRMAFFNDLILTPKIEFYFFQVIQKNHVEHFNKYFKGVSIGEVSARAPPVNA